VAWDSNPVFFDYEA